MRPRKSATLSPPNPDELERESLGTFALGADSRSPNSRLRVAAEWALLWLLIVAFAVVAFIPACRNLNSDFPNYYLVARLYRAGFKLDRVYDWTWLQRQKDYAGIDQGLITFIPLTLPSALIMRPLASLPPLQAKRCWLAANLLFLLLIAGLLTRISDLNWRQVGLLMFLAIVPLRSNFMLGQMHVLILLLLTFALWLYLRRFHFTAGIMLAVAAALKLYPALFLVFFIFKRQWRAAIGLTAGLLGSALLSLYVFGKTACEVYVREILPSALRGETIDPYHVAFGSITALLRRLFIAEPELNPAPVAHLPWLYALLQPAVHTLIFMLFLCAIGPREGDQQKVKRDWALYIFLLLFISSQPAGYHFVVLILPATLILDEIARKRGRVLARVGVAMYALTCLSTFPLFFSPSGWQSLLFFPRFWLMAILSSGLLFWSFSAGSGGMKHKLSVGTKSLVGGIAIILIIAGFYSTERHLSGEFDNYKNRVATSPDSLFAANPAVNSDGILFTAMTKGGYTIRHAEAGFVRDLPRTDGDWFHPALAQHSDFFWVEQATDYGSRIVQMENTVPTPTRTSVEIEDAMEPVVSRDGEWLAFFRAVKGRNSLWVQRIGSLGEGSRLLSSRQLAGPEYDARGADFISDDQLIFSSGDGRLLLADLANNRVLREWVAGCFARDPAVSPNGRWIAFSCRQKGNWQLHTMGFHDHAELQLTIGECNSITPAWTTDSKSLIYATDCGRGVGLTALARINVNP